MAFLHHTTFSSVVYRLCYSSHSSLIHINSSYKHTPRPKGSHTGLPTTYYLLLWSTTAVPSLSPGSSTVAIAPPPGFLSMTRRHRHRTKSAHVNSSTDILVLKPNLYWPNNTALSIFQSWEMTGTCSLWLVCRLWNVDDGRQAGRLTQARLRLREADFLLTQIRLVLLFLSVQKIYILH